MADSFSRHAIAQRTLVLPKLIGNHHFRAIRAFDFLGALVLLVVLLSSNQDRLVAIGAYIYSPATISSMVLQDSRLHSLGTIRAFNFPFTLRLSMCLQLPNFDKFIAVAAWDSPTTMLCFMLFYNPMVELLLAAIASGRTCGTPVLELCRHGTSRVFLSVMRLKRSQAEKPFPTYSPAAFDFARVRRPIVFKLHMLSIVGLFVKGPICHLQEDRKIFEFRSPIIFAGRNVTCRLFGCDS